MADMNCADFKEAVCIDAGRVYDSCSDKDCLVDLTVLFPEAIQRTIIDAATAAKIKNVKVINVSIDVQPVPFNKGFYSVDLTYYFEVTAEVSTAHSPACTVVGVATANKKAILFGSDGGVRVFSTDCCDKVCEDNNMPKAKVQVLDPIVLDSKLVPSCDCPCNVKIPECILKYFKCSCFGRNPDRTIDSGCEQKDLKISLGLFSIIMLERRVQMLVPCYDFCIPDKDCSQTVSPIDSPCELFEHITFPTEQFFPPRLDIETGSCGC